LAAGEEGDAPAFRNLKLGLGVIGVSSKSALA